MTTIGSEPASITFTQGTLSVTATPEQAALTSAHLKWDDRTHTYRAEARHYADIVLAWHRAAISYQDQAKGFSKRLFSNSATTQRDPPMRPHQKLSLQRWIDCGGRGVVVLPTGSGKSLVARMAIRSIQRDTLILVPTIDLMHQWYDQLSAVFSSPVGLMGGGEYQIAPITVSTYDSALIHMENLGNRFGFLICDECHHLPAPTTRLVAIMSIAPYRLGLTATPEREDGQEQELYNLLGPLCHRSEISELEGDYLAPYRLNQLSITLDPDEREAYNAAYAYYRGFAQNNGLSFKNRQDWTRFIYLCARSREGRAALIAYRTQKQISRASRAKLRCVWQLLRRHCTERILLFTDDNATAYTIGETFFLPVMTHKTRVSERKMMLDCFRKGTTPFLVTSRVLNEGVDVPEVGIGIIVSGSGSVREHVQRLGRILRPLHGKQAILYELVSEETAEVFTSKRRRQHMAYQR